MKTRNFFFLALVMVMIFSVTVPAFADTVKLGGLAPLTGPYAVYGLAVKNGIDLYVDTLNANGGINGDQVEVLWEDDASDDPAVALQLYGDLYDKGCVGLLGPVLTPQCLAVSDYAYEDGMPMITASGTDANITLGKDFVYRTCFIDDFQGYVMANFAADQGYTDVAILYGADSAYSNGLVVSFEAQAAAKGLNIVAKESASFTDVDFKAQLTNIKAAGPKAVFVPFYGPEAALILTQAAEIGLETIYMGADGISSIVDSISDKALLTSMTYSDHFAFDSDSETVTNFIKEYEAKYNETPSVSFAATAYDAALVMCETIKVAGTKADDINEQIKVGTYEGVSGIISFDENNNPIKSAFVMSFDAEGAKHFVAKVDP